MWRRPRGRPASARWFMSRRSAPSPEAASVYARSKAEGEAAVREVFPDAVILRPSIVFGPEDDFFNRFAALARIAPVLPLIGGGNTRFQPVFAGDVAKAVVAGLTGEAKPGAPYELGGPEVLTLKEVMERVLTYTMRKRLLVPVPFWLAKLKGAFLQLLPKPLLTVDQVRLLETDNVVSEAAKRAGRTLEGLGIEPVAVAAVVPGLSRAVPPARPVLGLPPETLSASGVEQDQQEAAEHHAIEHEGQEADAAEQLHQEGDRGETGDEGEAGAIDRVHGDPLAARQRIADGENDGARPSPECRAGTRSARNRAG